jgi:hypothetical protein
MLAKILTGAMLGLDGALVEVVAEIGMGLRTLRRSGSRLSVLAPGSLLATEEVKVGDVMFCPVGEGAGVPGE